MSDATETTERKSVYVVTYEEGGILQSTEAFATYDAALEYVRTCMKDENPTDWTSETGDEYPEQVWSWYEYASDDGAHYVIHELEPLAKWEPPAPDTHPKMQPSPAFLTALSDHSGDLTGTVGDVFFYQTEPHGAHVVREIEGDVSGVPFKNRLFEVREGVTDAIPVTFTGEELESLARITATLRGDDFAPFGREPKDFVRADGAAHIDESFLRSLRSFLVDVKARFPPEAGVAIVAAENIEDIDSVLEDARGNEA